MLQEVERGDLICLRARTPSGSRAFGPRDGGSIEPADGLSRSFRLRAAKREVRGQPSRTLAGKRTPDPMSRLRRRAAGIARPTR